MGLLSSFFLIDYKGTNTTFEKQENLLYVKNKLIIGLAMTTFGFILSSNGLSEQLKQLMPKQ